MLKNSTEFWGSTWSKHFNTYKGAIPRQAYYLSFFLKFSDRKLLEIAGGSFRDTAQLNDWGYQCYGVDFSLDAVKMAQEAYPSISSQLIQMDAESLKFKDNEFDVSYHNGFYVCFDDDQIIETMIKEQVRVTKRAVIITVHNNLNKKLIQKFSEKSKEDQLYDIRFFHQDEILKFLKPYCNKIEILPFGNVYMDILIKYMKQKTILKYIYKTLKCLGLLNMSKSERIMAIGYLS